MTIKTYSLVIVAAVMFAEVGCVEDDRSFYIRQNQIPESGCVVGVATDTLQGRGLLDVSAGFGYFLFPLVENQLIPTSTDNQPERNNLFMQGFDVSLDMGEIPGSFSESDTQFFVPVSGMISVGESIAFAGVEVIKSSLVSGLTVPTTIEPVINVKIRAIADRSGERMESAEFIYPVALCSGCLVDMRTTCPDKEEDGTVISNACGLPQDNAVTCCIDNTTKRTKCFSDED